MNSRMKRLRAVGLALLVLLHSLFAAAQNPLPKAGKVLTEYGMESRLPMPSEIMRRAMIGIRRGMSVRELRRSPQLFKHAGGIMFDAVAQPCQPLSNARLRLSYDRARPDGRRLTLRAGPKAYTVAGVYDRDLRPIAEFSDDTVPVLTNVQTPDEALSQTCPLPGDLKLVSLHTAFFNTELGRLLTSMDSVPWSFSRGKRWNSPDGLPKATEGLSKSLASALIKDEAGYKRTWPELWVEYVNAGEDVLRVMDADQKKHFAGLVESLNKAGHDWEETEEKVVSYPGVDRSKWERLAEKDRRMLLLFIDSLSRVRVSNINDDDIPPSFCAQGSEVKLDGSLQIQFIAPRQVDNYVLPTSSRLMTDNLPQLRLVDQQAYDAVMEIYRLGGLFRYVRKQSRPAWNQFLSSLPRKEERDTFTIVCPDCTEAEVKGWLDCLEEHFPSPRAPEKSTRRAARRDRRL